MNKDYWLVFVLKETGPQVALYLEGIFETEIDAQACEMSLKLDNKIAYIRKQNSSEALITLW